MRGANQDHHAQGKHVWMTQIELAQDRSIDKDNNMVTTMYDTTFRGQKMACLGWLICPWTSSNSSNPSPPSNPTMSESIAVN